MRSPRQHLFLWFCLLSGLALASGSPTATGAQAGFSTLVSAPARTSSRSELIPMGPADELAIDLPPETPATAMVTPYVHAEGGALVCADDPEGVTAVFTCRPPGPGRVFVLVHNSGDVDVRVRITRRQVRGDAAPVADYATVRVLFATNRAIGSGVFTTDPAPRPSFGYADVSIPRAHEMGELEGPSIFRLELRIDPSRHVAVLRTEVEDQHAFLRRVRERSGHSLSRDVLVFVHGFNVAFDDAIRRTAQMSYDLGFAGAPITFSWPSHAEGSPLAYQRDVRNADLSAESLVEVLGLLKAGLPDANVHIIAHSMGNRVLTAALLALQHERAMNQIALIAPDVDAALFRQVAPKIAAKAMRVTLYASSADLALGLSNAQAGYARAGQSGDDLVVVPGIDTIDASLVDTSALGLFHSYYGDNSTMLADLFNLIRGVSARDRFGLAAVSDTKGQYFRFRRTAR